MKWAKVRVSKEYIILLFLIIPLLRPEFISNMYEGSFVDTIFLFWKFVAVFMIVCRYLLSAHKGIDWDIVLVIVYEVYLLGVCIYNNVSINARIVSFGNFLGILLLFKFYGSKDIKLLVKGVFDWLFFLIVVNGILTVLFPRGLNRAESITGSARINFMGRDNMITLVFILAVLCGVLYNNIFYKQKKVIFLNLIIILTALYYFSGSGVVAMFAIYVYVIFGSKSRIIQKIITPMNIIILFCVLEVIVVFGEVSGLLNVVFEILGKTSTFTDRVYYWSTALLQISVQPFIGLGDGTVALWSGKLYSHNAVLDVAMKGGIIGLILWGCIIALFMRKLNTLKNNKEIRGLLCVIIFASLLIGLMEGLEDRIMFNAILSMVCVTEFYKDNQFELNIIRKGKRVED